MQSFIMKSHPTNRTNGFTLIEVIIAMSIFAIVAILSYTGLQSVINSKTITEASLDRLQELQTTMLTLSTDMQQLTARDAHDSLRTILPKLTTQNTEYIVSFTRSGWRNPANRTRSTLQRVAYIKDEDKLIRRYWSHVDRADDDLFVDRELINNIEDLELRYLDSENEWHDDWPTANALASGAATELPKAVEITLKMSDWGDIQRLVRVTN